jgi:AraC family transcriptional regulator
MMCDAAGLGQSQSCSLEAGTVVYAILPPHHPAHFTSVTPRGSIGVSFSGHRRAVRRYIPGSTRERDIVPGAAFVTMSADLEWLEVAEPADAVEFHLDPAYLRSVAHDLGASREPDCPEVDGEPDAVIWAIAALFRASLRRDEPPSDVHAAGFVLKLVTHVLVTYGGMERSRRIPRRLGHRRLRNVEDYIDAYLDRRISISDLAKAAALSPYHFARSFRLTTGLTPHAYVTARRMERARHLAVQTDLPTTAIAPQVGYSNVAHFRSSFVRSFGVTPARLRADDRRRAMRATSG